MDGVLQHATDLVQGHGRQAPLQMLALVPSGAELLAIPLCKVVGREDDVGGALAPGHLLYISATTPWPILTAVQQHCHGRSQPAD